MGLRRVISEHKELSGKIARLENRLADRDDQIVAIVKAIRSLTNPKPILETVNLLTVNKHQ